MFFYLKNTVKIKNSLMRININVKFFNYFVKDVHILHGPSIRNSYWPIKPFRIGL